MLLFLSILTLIYFTFEATKPKIMLEQIKETPGYILSLVMSLTVGLIASQTSGIIIAIISVIFAAMIAFYIYKGYKAYKLGTDNRDTEKDVELRGTVFLLIILISLL